MRRRFSCGLPQFLRSGEIHTMTKAMKRHDRTGIMCVFSTLAGFLFFAAGGAVVSDSREARVLGIRSFQRGLWTDVGWY
jgi:hypothetical protein